MPINRYRPALAGAVCLAASGMVGCQSYVARPLDPTMHRDLWNARSALDGSVQAFADRLDAEGHTSAGTFNPSDGLDLAEAEIVALVFNPDLRLARLRADVASATAAHAGRWDDPEFAIDVLGITESVPNPWVVTPGIGFTLPVSGRLEVEKARAQEAKRAALERIVESEWQVRRDLRLAWFEWSAARLRLQEQRRLIDAVSSLLQSTAALAEAGEMMRTEAALFAIERVQGEQELRRLTGLVQEGRQRIHAIMGLSPEAAAELLPTIAGPQTAAPMGSEGLPDHHPTLVRLRQEYQVAEQTLHREIRRQYPDITIGPLYEFDQGQSRIGFLGAIPIPVLNGNRQAIAEAEAERELARAVYETQYERLAGSLAASRARADALRGEREYILQEVAPLVDRQLDDARRLLELGEGGGLVLLESLIRAHETRLRLIDVRADEARVSAELEYLAGPAKAILMNTPTDAPLNAAEEVTP